MEDFFNKGFFSDNQYGFIKGRSTVLQLLKIFDDWTYQNQGVQIDVIYTDFEKAFDTVPHLGLIICATEQDTVMYLYADDAKVYSTITCNKDHLHQQKVIDHIKEWCDQWLLPLNINVFTCHTLPG